MHISESTRRSRSFHFIATFSLLAAVGCSTPGPQVGAGPEVDQSPKGLPGTETITILGTNDIHGALAPMEFKTREPMGVEPIPYEAGGAAYLASYVKRLRSELGDRLIWLDGGDEYQGTIESNSTRGSAMVAFFNAAGLDAAAIGNHEFDFGADPAGDPDRTSSLKKRMSEAHYPYLAANIYNQESGKLEAFPNTLPSKIFSAGKVKVGVIGLSTLDTPTTTRPENVAQLRFGSLKEATLREAKALRKDGADIVLITAHVGIFCDLAHTPPGHILRHPDDPQGDCNSRSEMVQLLNSLPAGTVDAVVSGHSHSVVHHYVAGVPVIQGGSNGRYFNLIHLVYDTKNHRLLSDHTTIEGPIPVCPMVFKNQGDCNGDRPAPSIGRGPLVRPVFRRKEISADSSVQKTIEPAIASAKQVKSEIYGQAVRPIEHLRERESPLGNLIADSFRNATQADFALINAGAIRASLEQGPIRYGNIFRTLPFDNTLVVLTVTGKQLKTLLRVAESGSRGFPPVSGLKLKLISPDSDAPADDLDHDGKIEPWEINRLIDVETSSGEAIDDRKEYKLATIDFLVSGGDDLAWPMKQIPASHREYKDKLMRDVAGAYIRTVSAAQGGINSLQHPLVSAENPRFVFEKPKLAKGKKKKGRHHSKKGGKKRKH